MKNMWSYRLIEVGVLLGGLAIFGGAQAQCTKDTDCKGERICEKGICLAPAASGVLGKNLTRPVPAQNETPKAAVEQVSQSVQDQLTCAVDPEPGKALRALRARGYIGQKPKLSVDGMNIYAVVKPLSVFGFRVLYITGWEQNGDPSLFWRGPGTAPPLNIAAVVDGAPAAVKAEVQRQAGKAPSVGKAAYFDETKITSEITCYGK